MRLLALILTLAFTAHTFAADWLQFRGSENRSTTSGDKLPTEISSEKNVAWKSPLVGKGVSGPIVVGKKVFVTASSGPVVQDRLHVLCFDADSGKQLWHRQFWATGRCFHHPTSANAAPTPASDGQRVYAFYSSSDLVCLDLDGNLQWYRGLGSDYPKAGNDVGMSSSPLVSGGAVVVQIESQGDSFATGVDALTGETLWREDRKLGANWASPALLRDKEGKEAVLLQSSDVLTAHEPRSGKQIWKFDTSCSTIPSATAVSDKVFLPAKGLTLLEATATSTSPTVAWESNRLAPGNSSPVIVGEQVYILNSAGVLTCGDATNGDVLWQQRLAGKFWATPVVAGEHIYCINDAGKCFVVKLGAEKPEEPLTGELGEAVLASPAVSGNALFIRTGKASLENRRIVMTSSLEIQPCGPIRGSIQPPGSKSITNRALVIAALAEGNSTLRGALASEDTQVMIESLARLGVRVVESDAEATLEVVGCGGRVPNASADLFIGNSGTTVRFLTAMLAACSGKFRLDGVPRMRERPIADLIATLNKLGGNVRSEMNTGCPPVVMDAQGLAGGTANIRGDVSSQFLSALLMAAPYARETVNLIVDGVLVSQPYVHMTLGLMRDFGVDVPAGELTQFKIPGGQRYRGREYSIEPDASAASYFWGAAAVTGGDVLVRGLLPTALQGDVGFVDCLAQMGCEVRTETDGIRVIGKPLRGIDVDMNAISDTAQTLGVVALFAEGPTTIRGIAHVRHKETDRIGDLARELRKFGAAIEEFEDGLRITPPANYEKFSGASIATYKDHRMAMSFALAGLKLAGVVINDPGCTAKTYPRFFEDLKHLIAGS